MNQITAEELAEQIAALLRATDTRDNAGLRSEIERLKERLDRIDSDVSENRGTMPAVSAAIAHPSVERFKSLGEIADVILERFGNQKDCPYEPAAKPCDNCSMCSSRGF